MQKTKRTDHVLRVKMDAKHQRLLDALADHLDLDWSKVVRLAVRELAKREKIT